MFYRETKPVSLGSDVTSSSSTSSFSEKQEVYTRIQLVKWAPTGHSFVIVHDGDIYYFRNPKQNRTYRITSSAQPGVIYNGIPDWLYEGTEQETVGFQRLIMSSPFSKDGYDGIATRSFSNVI